MKQAQVDADELIAAYRLEQQDAFDKKANADGKLNIFLREQSIIVVTPHRLTNIIISYSFYNVMNTLYHTSLYCSLTQVDPVAMPRPNSKPKPMPTFKTCRDNSNQMPKRPLMFF